MKSPAGRVLGFALVLVLVMSVVGLAVSQTFINKTGKTVTGIKVEFSRRVLISRHDSVFPDQSPSGRNDEFTFDAGSLRNLGRFTVYWTPSSGKVVDYEWIGKIQHSEGEQSPTQQNGGPSLPDPNTPPILYGDDYPGSDEPKYQPAEDEQIWLTDPEGHGDIYDNDSIKINYAPGFDVSQIEKISVYRNGVYMRFLPEKFDVLTNAQMKTFDGNPAEHSPASAQTDHAIMGYEYEFRISTSDNLWILKKMVKSGFHWRPKYVYFYIYPMWAEVWSRYHFTDEDILRFFQIMKANDFNGISTDMSYFMTSPYDNTLTQQYTVNPNIHEWITSSTDQQLRHLLTLVNKAGLESEVRAQLYISNAFSTQHSATFYYGANIMPNDVALWFKNYGDITTQLAKILEEYHVARYTPFTEMDSLEQYPDELKQFYDRVAEVFHGSLGFEESTNHYLEGYGFTPSLTHGSFEELAGHFWNWKDKNRKALMIEWSCWTPPLSKHTDQHLSTIAENFANFWSPAMSYYHNNYPSSEIVYGEIGSYPVDGVSKGSNYFYSHLGNQKWDVQEFNDVYATYLIGGKTLGVDGITLWFTKSGI